MWPKIYDDFLRRFSVKKDKRNFNGIEIVILKLFGSIVVSSFMLYSLSHYCNCTKIHYIMLLFTFGLIFRWNEFLSGNVFTMYFRSSFIKENLLPSMATTTILTMFKINFTLRRKIITYTKVIKPNKCPVFSKMYSGNLNNGLVWYSDGRLVSNS